MTIPLFVRNPKHFNKRKNEQKSIRIIVFVKIYGLQRHCKCFQIVVCTFSVREKERERKKRIKNKSIEFVVLDTRIRLLALIGAYSDFDFVNNKRRSLFSYNFELL